MNIGVLGCGYWGSKHVRVLSQLPGVTEVTAIDQREERLTALGNAFPGLSTARHLGEAGDLDAVVLATPPHTHAALATQLLEAGIHVLVEKPLALSTRDAHALHALARERGKTLMVGHTFEYNAAVTALRGLITSGELGDVLYIDTARLNLGLYQSRTNVIWDLAPHDVSIINHLLGDVPTRVAAWGSRHRHPELEDVAYLKLEYANSDVTAQIHVSWLDPQKVRRVTVVGDRKMAVYNDLAPEERLRVYDKGVGSPSDGDGMHAQALTYRYGGIQSPYIDFKEPLAVEDEHFVACISTGACPLTDGANGLAVVQTLEAAQLSLEEGSREVELSELEVSLVGV